MKYCREGTVPLPEAPSITTKHTYKARGPETLSQQLLVHPLATNSSFHVSVLPGSGAKRALVAMTEALAAHVDQGGKPQRGEG